MSLSIRDVTVPVFKRSLKNLDAILVKAAQHAEATATPAHELLDAKLAPDMFDCKRQVQIACDHAKGCVARLAGMEPPAHADTEKSIDELRARIAKTLAFIDSIDAAAFAGAETRDITLKYPWATYEFTGLKLVTNWSLPNFYFHVTTAYAILRHKGVPLGKADFLGG